MRLKTMLKYWLKSMMPDQVYWLPRYYLLSKIADFKGKNAILDAGCGQGIMSEALCKADLNVIGIDLSFNDLKTAVTDSKQKKYVRADVCALPFKGAAFDLIYSLDVLNCVQDVNSAFSEFHRVLKPQGRLIVSVISGYSCTGDLFLAQRGLRKLIPKFLWTHNFPGKRRWLDYTSEEMAKKLYSRRTYSIEQLDEITKPYFTRLRSVYGMKLCASLATDIAYGIKGLRYFKSLMFMISVRLDYYLFNKMKGYSLFAEFVKK